MKDLEEIILRLKPRERRLYTKEENGNSLDIYFVAFDDKSVYILGNSIEIIFEANDNSYDAALTYLDNHGYKLAPTQARS